MARKLISADKVEGTRVVNRRGEDLGSIEDVMIDKVSGQVTYAVLSYGGILGMGDKLYPLPWDILTYDQDAEAYVIDLPQEKLKAGPGYDSIDQMPDIAEPQRARDIHQHYGSRADWYVVERVP